jgi:hypothetical protein
LGSNPQFVNARFQELEAGATATVPLEMGMPAIDVDIYVTLWYGRPGQGEANYAGYTGPYRVLVRVDEWVDLGKPDWLHDALESDWLNWRRGDWVSWSIIVIPPFSFTPGHWIETAVDWLLEGLNTIVNWSKRAWDAQWEQNIGLAGLIRELTGDVSDIRNLFGDIGAFFDQIFDRMVKELGQVEPFKTLISLGNTLLDFLPDDWAELKNLLLNPVEYFFDKFDDWLNEEVTE